MRKYLIVSSLLVFCSCQIKEPSKEFRYFYTTEVTLDSLTNKPLAYKSIVSADSVSIFDDQRLLNKIRYKLTDSGICVLTDTSSLLLYPFKDTSKILRDESLHSFFYNSVRLINKRSYSFKGQKKIVYHFIESGFDETLDSYYLEDVGFICFYKYAQDHYLFLDSPDAFEISGQFLGDSSFFAMIHMREIDKKMGRKFE